MQPALTAAQLQAIKAEINADAALAARPNTPDDNEAIAVELNRLAAPDYIVWRGRMRISEIEQNGFAWAQLDNVPGNRYRIWERLAQSDGGFINPSKANVRAGISEFAKTATGAVIQVLVDSIMPHTKRRASRAEKALAAGLATDASPSTMGAEGPINRFEVEAARNIA